MGTEGAPQLDSNGAAGEGWERHLGFRRLRLRRAGG
jgi:hypothetical protein